MLNKVIFHKSKQIVKKKLTNSEIWYLQDVEMENMRLKINVFSSLIFT